MNGLSEYSELIKKFDKIRDYMRDFYVYGFKSREDFNKKSLRSYDNEKRRIESYLSDFMSFRQDENGKSVFLSVDSSDIPSNPFYRAFKAKSFTKNDITLNFLILDILFDGKLLSATEIADIITVEYLKAFENPTIPDISTIRKKLLEYVSLGILKKEKQGKKLLFSINNSDVNLNCICDALIYFSEVSELGIIGSTLLDKCNYDNHIFAFKHNYIMHALESEIVYELLETMHMKKTIQIVNHGPRSRGDTTLLVVPLKILISVQGGRRYLSAYDFRTKDIMNFRIDYIKSVKPISNCKEYDKYLERLCKILCHTWGASFGKGRNLEHLSMTLNVPHNERFIVNRIEREGRFGILTRIDETTYRYDIDVYDASEMIPWLRTFIGRIISLECDKRSVVDTFNSDLDELFNMYGG